MGKKKIRVLHITGHMGGGVGAVVLNFLCRKKEDTMQKHDLLSFDRINKPTEETLKENTIEFYDQSVSRHNIVQLITQYDLVLLHWWNHPLISEFLVNEKLPPNRLIIWSHISGNGAPNNFTTKIFRYADKFVFTTPISYLGQDFQSLPEVEKHKIEFIWSTAGIDRIKKYPRESKDDFNIGFIGNFDPIKFHRDFFVLCERINIPNKKFTIIGPKSETLLEKISCSPIKDKIEFTGYLSEDEKWYRLSQFDVFGYPLAPNHYGTCDQTIQEAMAVGVPPVVLNNPMESYMVEHGKSGIVANSTQDYIDWMEALKSDSIFRCKLGNNSRRRAEDLFSINKLLKKWDTLFEAILSLPKSSKAWSYHGEGKMKPYEIFLESLGSYKGPFSEEIFPRHLTKKQAKAQICSLGREPNWSSRTKSTVHHYSTFFPKCGRLRKWSKLMDNLETT